MRYKSILFDLDGTVTDSTEGIINSIMYALEKLEYVPEDTSVLKKFIGPPLLESFKNYFGFSDEKSELALKFYREYYVPKGLYQNRVYDGIEELLLKLNAKGYDVLLATSKPEPQAREVINHFKLTKYFSFIAGVPLNEKGYTKIDVINYALEHTATKDKSEILMVGDTHFDVEGAKACGIDSVGVLYGMGDAEELKEATYIVKTVKELEDFLLK